MNLYHKRYFIHVFSFDHLNSISKKVCDRVMIQEYRYVTPSLYNRTMGWFYVSGGPGLSLLWTNFYLKCNLGVLFGQSVSLNIWEIFDYLNFLLPFKKEFRGRGSVVAELVFVYEDIDKNLRENQICDLVENNEFGLLLGDWRGCLW